MKSDYSEKYIRLGLKIAYYRKLRGMTQEQFADFTISNRIFSILWYTI